jgi:glucan biosynthesis protein
VDLAPAEQPETPGREQLQRREPAWFRPAAAWRDFSHYEDLDDRYDKRPSAWIEPKGDWGKGTVDLVEIPTADETNDNIVAFWSPESCRSQASRSTTPTACTGPWTKPLPRPDSAWVKQTLRSTGDVKQSNLIRQPDGSVAYLVDFEGPPGGPAGTPPCAARSALATTPSGREQPALQPGNQGLAPDPADEGQGRQQVHRDACRAGA